MSSGYILKELRLTGKTVKDACIVFDRRVNVITGPSNTGKSYIFKCLNYMFGGSKPPKPITESRAYDSIFLEIIDSENIHYTLMSDLKGGNFKLFEKAIDDIKESDNFEILDRKHSPSNDKTVSAFLLGLNNLYGKKIRTNQKGKTRQVSYRDIVKFSMVNETQITTEDSLIISHYTKATEESNVLKLITSGNDDSKVIASLTQNQIANRKGKIEVLKEFIIEYQSELKSFKEDPTKILLSTNERIDQLSEEYMNLQKQFNEIENNRKNILEALYEKKSRNRVLEELHKRSNLLKSHYLTDVARLKSTIETSELLNEENHSVNSNCPLCNSEIKEECSIANVERIIDSCSIEIHKIEILLQELYESEKDLKNELDRINEEVETLNNDINKYTSILDKGVGSKMNLVTQEIKDLNDNKSNTIGVIVKFKQLEKYIAQKEKLEETIPDSNSKQVFESITTASLSDLSLAMKNSLEGYKYPNLNGVSFSEENIDFVISGEDRSLSGKGYRAIIYSAFILALQDLILNKDYSIGVPIMDSPLVTYKKPENNGEIISDDLAMDFYRYIVNKSKLEQIIVIENEEPPIDTVGKINHIKFTRQKGFIPPVN